MCSLLYVRHGLLVELQVSFKKERPFLRWISEYVNALMIARGTRYLCCWFVKEEDHLMPSFEVFVLILNDCNKLMAIDSFMLILSFAGLQACYEL